MWRLFYFRSFSPFGVINDRVSVALATICIHACIALEPTGASARIDPRSHLDAKDFFNLRAIFLRRFYVHQRLDNNFASPTARVLVTAETLTGISGSGRNDI